MENFIFYAVHVQKKGVWSPWNLNRLKTLKETDKTLNVLNKDNSDYVARNSWKPLFRKLGNH